jgi:hypothetical protein
MIKMNKYKIKKNCGNCKYCKNGENCILNNIHVIIWNMCEKWELKKQSKYHNKKIIIDDKKFDSYKEGNRYNELKLLKKINKIKDLELQKTFELQPTFKKNGETFRSIKYIADFYYFDLDKQKFVVEDVKAFSKKEKKFLTTSEFKIKKKLFEFKFKDLEIKEV